MRGTFVGRFLVVALAFTPTVAAADPPTPGVDWVVVTVTAGPLGATGSLVAILTQSYPLGPVIGMGTASAWRWHPLVVGNSEGRIAVRTTQSLGGVDIEVKPQKEAHPGLSGVTYSGDLPPNFTYRGLFFSPGVTFAPELSWEQQSGDMTVTAEYGTGSQAVRFAEADGYGAELGTNAAGDFSATRTTPAEIVGGFLDWLPGCTECEATWTDPTGYSRTFRQSASGGLSPSWSPVSSEPGFWGVAGTWRWSWRGIQVSELAGGTAMFAYAPIGRAAIPPRNILGPQWCGGASVVQHSSCSIEYAGGAIEIHGQSEASVAGAIAIRLVAPDGSVIASCNADGLTEQLGDGFIDCDYERGPAPLPIGTELACEADGRVKFHYTCLSIPS